MYRLFLAKTYDIAAIEQSKETGIKQLDVNVCCLHYKSDGITGIIVSIFDLEQQSLKMKIGPTLLCHYFILNLISKNMD